MKTGDRIGVFKGRKKVNVLIISEAHHMGKADGIVLPPDLNYQNHEEVEKFLQEALAEHRLWPEAEGPYLWKLTSIPPIS